MKRRELLQWVLKGTAVSLLPLSLPAPPQETWLSMESPLVGHNHFFLVPAYQWPYFQVQWGAKPQLPGDPPPTGPLHQRTSCWSGYWRVERLGWKPDRLELTMHPFDPVHGERRVLSLPGPLHVGLIHKPPFETGYDYLEVQHPAEWEWARGGDYLTEPACHSWVESIMTGKILPGDHLPWEWRERGQFYEVIG